MLRSLATKTFKACLAVVGLIAACSYAGAELQYRQDCKTVAALVKKQSTPAKQAGIDPRVADFYQGIWKREQQEATARQKAADDIWFGKAK